MATLLSSDEIDIRLLFSEPVSEVMQFLRQVVRQQEPIALELEGRAHIVNLACVKHFVLADQDPDDESLDSDDQVTVAMSIAGVRE